MIEPRVVKRYASALFAEADREGAVDLVEIDLGLINYSLQAVPNLGEVLSSPLIPASKKREIVSDVFSGKIHDVTLRYLFLLIDKRREEVVKYTEDEYIRLANEARGIVTASVTTAVELSSQEMTGLKNAFSGITGKSVELDIQTDPSIIGGVIVRIGDRVWDGSVTGYLASLKEQLLSGQMPHETE